MGNLRKRFSQALYQSESYLKLDIVYLTTGSFWTIIRFVVGILASLATMIAFGNLLPRETYGIYSYLLALASSLGFLTLAGIGTGIVRAVARGQENVVRYSLRMQLRYNLLAVAGIAIAGLYYSVNGNSTFAISLWILALALPLSAAYHTFEYIFIGKKRFDLLALVTSGSSIVATVSTIIGLMFTDEIIVLITIYSVMSLGPNMFSYWYAQHFLSNSEPSPEAIAELRRTAFHLTGAGIIGTIAQYLDKIVLFQIAGPAALAVYTFAVAGPERLKGLIKNIISIALPRFAEKTLGEIGAISSRRFAMSLVVGIIFAASYILIAPFLFKLLLPKYLDSILYSQVYALGLIVLPTTVYIGNIFAGQNMLRAIYAHSISGYVTRIFLFLLMGWLWQTWGLVFASIISYVLVSIYGIIILKVESKRILTKQNEQGI